MPYCLELILHFLFSRTRMPEPTKEQIQEVFKKLKQNRYNKVKRNKCVIIA